MQNLRVLAKHKFLGALRGKRHWPPPKEVRETFKELGLTFLKFGQVLAMRRDLLPDAYIDELELLHDQLPALSIYPKERRQTMTKDPICGMTVDEGTVLRAERDGETHYFCSDHCRQKFLSTPVDTKPEDKSGG